MSSNETRLLALSGVLLAAWGCDKWDDGPVSMVAPYANASDMAPVREAFSTNAATAPWGFVHTGIDFFPTADQEPFRAVAGGFVSEVRLWQNDVSGNWQVNVTVKLNDAFSVAYSFEPMTGEQADGEAQLANLLVSVRDNIAGGYLVGYLHAPNSE